MEKTIEKSEEQAEIIKMIAVPIVMLDTEYCREAAAEMLNQANRQESMAILNPSHPQAKNDLLRMQGVALSHLVQYVESLQKVEEIKKEVVKQQGARDQISRLFL
jgi:hypothetical protein